MIPLDQQQHPPHYQGVHCPTCKQDVLPRDGTCPWCDGRLVCKHGHPLEGDNLVVWRGRRECRRCEAARHHTDYWRNPEASRARRLADYHKRKARA